MEKAEIIAGLRSALARGYSLEFAKKSFVNAGYNSQDVEDSAALLTTGRPFQPYQPAPVQLSSQLTAPIQNSSVSSIQPVQPQPVQSVQVQPSPIHPIHSYKPLPIIQAQQAQSSSYQRMADELGRPKRKGIWLVILLIIIFLAVLGVLGLLIFKRELAESILQGWGLI